MPAATNSGIASAVAMSRGAHSASLHRFTATTAPVRRVMTSRLTTASASARRRALAGSGAPCTWTLSGAPTSAFWMLIVNSPIAIHSATMP